MCSNPQDRREYLRELDIELRQMIQEARSFPDGSSKRRKIVNRLILKIFKSGEVKTEGDDIYQDALQETMEWFGQNWCNFNPKKAEDPKAATVIGWLKHTLYHYKIPDAKRKAENSRSEKVKQGGCTIKIRLISETVGKDGETRNVLDDTIDPKENPQAEIERREIVTRVRGYIKQHRVLTTIYVPDHPEIHCQRLLLKLLPEWREDTQDWIREKSWEELEQEFGVPKRKLQNCYKRCFNHPSIQQLQNDLDQWRRQ